MVTRTVQCPNCDTVNEAEIDLAYIEHGETYHQSVDCSGCDLPFVMAVRASFEWMVGKVKLVPAGSLVIRKHR